MLNGYINLLVSVTEADKTRAIKIGDTFPKSPHPKSKVGILIPTFIDTILTPLGGNPVSGGPVHEDRSLYRENR